MVEAAVTGARDEILGRIRHALADVPAEEQAEDVVVERSYRGREPEGTLDRFIARVRDYGASVRIAATDNVAAAVGEACAELGVERLAVPPDVPPAWLPDGPATVVDEGLSVTELDGVGAALTGCALGIAETGTVVLDGGARQGRRLLSLVPDVHICVIDAEQVVDGVPAAIRCLAGVLRSEGRPLTFVSGPSATADIEFSRVEGVHGPRRFALIVAQAPENL
jgi:L-lactate dehydrogenase complex protein LldG